MKKSGIPIEKWTPHLLDLARSAFLEFIGGKHVGGGKGALRAYVEERVSAQIAAPVDWDSLFDEPIYDPFGLFEEVWNSFVEEASGRNAMFCVVKISKRDFLVYENSWEADAYELLGRETSLRKARAVVDRITSEWFPNVDV